MVYTHLLAIIKKINPVCDKEQLFQLQQQATSLHVSPAIFDYVQSILSYTRQTSAFEFGLSPRGGLALINAAKAYAFIEGEKYVLPEHVQAILPAVANHRLPVHLENGLKQTISAAELILESTNIS